MQSENKEIKKFIVVPEIYYAILHNVTVIGGCSLVKLKGSLGVYDSFSIFKGNRYSFNNEIIIFHGGNNCIIKVLQTKKREIDYGIMLSGGGSNNYCHFLLEFVPKLCIYNFLNQYNKYKLLVDKDILNYPQFIEIIEYYSKRLFHDMVFLERGYCYNVNELIYPSPHCWIAPNLKPEFSPDFGDFIISKTGIEFLRTVLQDYGKSNKKRLRLFIYRKNDSYRKLINLDEITSFFKKNNYEVVVPEYISFKEQVQLFSRASHIAGPAGAGFTNMIFAPQGCNILLMTPYFGDFNFWKYLSILLNHKIVGIEGIRILQGNNPNNYYQCDYYTPIDKIKNMMNNI